MYSLRQSQLTDFFKLKRNTADEAAKSATIKASQRVSKSKRLTPVNLPLPAKYRQLLEKFRHCDAIVGRLYNRNERCSLQRLLSAVECITKVRMTKRNLAQIVTVYPHSFKVMVEKFKNNLREDKEDLFIYPDFTDYPDSDKIISPTLLSRRLIKFRRILLQMTIKSHEKFLQALPIPISIDSSRVRRWHPKFNLEVSTPDIIAAPFPEPNVNDRSKPVSGQMLLEIGKGIRSQRMKRVLERIALKRKDEALKKLSKFNSTSVDVLKPNDLSTVKGSASRQKQLDFKLKSDDCESSVCDSKTIEKDELNSKSHHRLSKAKDAVQSSSNQVMLNARCAITESNRIKGLSEKLLMKIRQREEKNKIEKLITSAPEYAEEQKISEVPKFVRTVRNYFLTEQRVAIPENKVRAKVMQSLSDINAAIYEMCLETSLREFSNWISRITIRGISYLKVRRNVDVNNLLSKLENQ